MTDTRRAGDPAPRLTPEEIGVAFAEAAEPDGWITAKKSPDGSARDWGPAVLAALYAADEDTVAAWVSDPDGCDLEITKPGQPVFRFGVRNPRHAPRKETAQ